VQRRVGSALLMHLALLREGPGLERLRKEGGARTDPAVLRQLFDNYVR
jgi:hypothetical protein